MRGLVVKSSEIPNTKKGKKYPYAEWASLGNIFVVGIFWRFHEEGGVLTTRRNASSFNFSTMIIGLYTRQIQSLMYHNVLWKTSVYSYIYKSTNELNLSPGTSAT